MMRLKSRRGFTLTEMAIVLALCSIIVTTVVIMIASLQAISKKNQENRDIIEDRSLVMNHITNWFHLFDEEGVLVNVGANGNIEFIKDSISYSIELCENGFIMKSPTEGEKKVNSSLEKILFTEVVSGKVYRCELYHNGEMFYFILSKRS